MKKKILILAAILVYGLGSFAGEEQPVSMSSAMVAQLTLDVPTLTSDQLAEITAIAQIYENNAEEINTTYSADIYSRAAAKQVAYEEYLQYCDSMYSYYQKCLIDAINRGELHVIAQRYVY